MVVECDIVGGWSLVNVEKHKDFKAVEYKKRCSCNWEEDWHTDTKHHRDKGNVQDSRVLIMNEELRSAPFVSVLLNCNTIRGVLFGCSRHILVSEHPSIS